MHYIKCCIFTLFCCFIYHYSYAQARLARGVKAVLSPQAVQVARQTFEHTQLLHNVSRGLVQISRPKVSSVLGTGFIFRAHKRLWVAMPYHIGGVAGSQRTIRFTGKDNLPQERLVTIAVNGNAGWHAPDVSLAPFPEEDAPFVTPLLIGKPSVNTVSYSFGYVSGREAGLDEVLPIKRLIFNAEGFGLIADRVIAGEDPAEPFNISGYCGSPVMQRIDGEWRAVGLHTGSCLSENGYPRSYAVNLPHVLPMLFRRYLKQQPGHTRSLEFRGWNIGSLLPSERVYSIEVVREGEQVFSVLLRNFPNPYSDGRSELALASFELKSGDLLRYEILNNQREMRFVEYRLP